VYMDEVYRLHGMPQIMVSDRDRIFTSQTWKELFRLSGTELRMSSAHHPKLMVKPRGLTRVWKLICAVLSKLALLSGLNG
jgi:hypothetical protein